ncbi:MAG: hypothetical protein IPO21_00960 [Bacteroidales bacterium]|nr:hypothetical protein [Bacteroidales bacterium]
MNKLILFVVVCLLGYTALQAQNVDGIARDSVTNEIVPFAHIYNISRRLVTASDVNGKFSITAQVGDTIIASSVGYFWCKNLLIIAQNCFA